MALVIKDRVKETTTTTGTNNLELAGAVSGFQGFVAAGITDTTYYALIDANGTAWEVGLGAISDGDPDTLTRTNVNVIASTNSNNRISLSSGTHTVFATYPAGKAVYLDSSGVLSHSIVNADISGSASIANSKLANSSVSFGGVSLALGASDATPAFDLSDATSYPTSSLSGTITNAQLAGSIANAKLANDGITIAGTDTSLGGSITADTIAGQISANTIAFTQIADLAQGSILYGNGSAATAELTKGSANTVLQSDGTDISWATVTNAMLAGSIANAKLANDSVSYGGVSLDLGGSDATPAFDLSDATNYPTSSLSGTITNAQLAGSIANAKLANSSITVSDGSNTTAVSLGGTITFSGTANEVEVGESSGTVTIGLPSSITANLTGNVTGNTSGSSGSCTGNAATATKLAATVDINGVAFDGSGDITITAAGSTLSDTVTVAKGGTGATSLTDGGILLGSGTGAVTAMSVLGNGVIVVGDNSTDPTTITAFTASDGVLKHEVGGLELDISAIAVGDVIAGTGTGSVGIVTSTGHSDGDVLTLQADGTADWETSSSGGASNINGLSDCLVEDNSIYLGNDPSSTTSTAARNIAIGGTALDAVTTADDTIAIGYNAGTAITADTSSKNILIGSYAGENLTINSNANVFIGYEAGHGLADGNSVSVAVGYQAGYSSSDDRANYTRNVHIGYQAGMEANNQYTVHVGNLAGQWNAGSESVAIGSGALKGTSDTPISTWDTVAIGPGAGSSSTGDRCIYLGHNAGSSNTSDKMLFIGWDSPSYNETIIKADMNNKHVAVGVADSLVVSAGSPTLQIYPEDAADEALYIKLTASHSGDALLVEDNSGNDKYRVTHGGAVKTGIKTNTDGLTITFDLDEANTHEVTLGDNRTLAISNEDEGQKFLIKLIQDGTGSRTVTWFSTIKWAAETAPTLTTTAGKADLLGFLCTGTGTYDGFIVGQNI